jgi:carbon storage regulator
MLVLTRRVGEELVIGDGIRITLVAIHGKQVRLGITAPEHVLIRRAELGCAPAEAVPPAAKEGEGWRSAAGRAGDACRPG